MHQYGMENKFLTPFDPNLRCLHMLEVLNRLPQRHDWVRLLELGEPKLLRIL